MEEKHNILSMEGITKIYSNGMLANNAVNFSARYGEIHALMGENGAGKSTLMKVLFGIEQPDKGVIRYQGEVVEINSPNDAIKMGIGMVQQHFNLVPSLTVAENIVLGHEPGNRILFNKKEAMHITKELAEQFNFDLDMDAVIEDISIGKKQKVEILKAIYCKAKLLILDEPTAVLTPQETIELFEQLEKLRKSGITIIFISHKLDELKRICQRITIMRKGCSMGTYNIDELSEKDISSLMVGRDVILKIDKKEAKPGKTVLDVKNLSYMNENGKMSLESLSFSLHEGEIVGIAGVEGSGQEELVNLITGMCGMTKGSCVTLCGKNVEHMSIKERRKAGLAFIPQDRITCGVAGNLSIKENLISSSYDSSEVNGKLLMKKAEITKKAKQNIIDYDIRCESEMHSAGMLSGGNMQKVVVAREFSTNPKVLIACQPTRGVDVGAIEFIHKKIVEIRDSGCAVILVSADLNEILELSDSIIVMHRGKMTAYFRKAQEVTEEELGYYMLGMKEQDALQLKEAQDEK